MWPSVAEASKRLILLRVRPKGGRAVFRIVVALLYVVCIFGFDVRVPTVIFVAALHVVAFYVRPPGRTVISVNF